MNEHRSRTEIEIPLYLLPQAVARKVWEWGDALYRISVMRTYWHHFNVTVRTRPVPKELAKGNAAVLSDAKSPVTKKPVAARRRRCAA